MLLSPYLAGFLIALVKVAHSVQSPKVTSVTYTDVATRNDVPIYYLRDQYGHPTSYLNLDLEMYPPNTNFTIRVKSTVGNVGSVEFEMSDNTMSFTTLDYQDPFTLRGEDTNGLFIPANVLRRPGKYTLNVAAYSGRGKQGASSISIFYLSIQGFRFVSVPKQYPRYQAPLMLMDARKNNEMGQPEWWYNNMFKMDMGEHPVGTEFTMCSLMNGTDGWVEYALYKYQNVSIGQYVPPFRPTMSNFQFNQPSRVFYSVQISMPYAMNGTTRAGMYNPVPAMGIAGVYQLVVKAYQSPNLRYLSDSTTLQYITLPPFDVTSLALMDVKSGKTQPLPFYDPDSTTPYATIYLSNYTSNKAFTIVASTGGTGLVGSVAFKLLKQVGSTFQTVVTTVTDNQAPFSLDGSSIAGKYSSVPALSVPGFYQLQFVPYAKPNQQGDHTIGNSIKFKVIGNSLMKQIILNGT